MSKKRIHPDLASKLLKKKAEYEKVTALSELLPIFENAIVQNELSADRYCRIAERFGKLPLAWGINWQVGTPTNYPEEKHSQVGFVNVYINCHSLFGDDCASFGRESLAKELPSIKVHFYDSWNSNFYFLPAEVEDGLKQLESWYLATKESCDTYLKQKRKEDLERQLKELS